MERNKRLERLLSLINALQSAQPRTVQELAKLIGVSRRTVFRDLELLESSGVVFQYDRGTGRYSAERASLLPPVTLTHAEALALALASQTVRRGGYVPDETVATSAALKLESILPQAVRDYCGPLLKRMEIRPDPASDVNSIRETLPIIQAALLNQRKLKVKYDSYAEGRIIDAVLHPHRLAYIHRGWYVVAYTEEVSRILTYKVERILRMRTLEDTYRMSRDFSLDEYFGNAWLMIRGDVRYHVKVRFLEMVAGNVDEVHWHKTQCTTFQKDGSLLFEVDVDGLEEISWWILGYGDQAQVLEPTELHDLIALRVRRMCAYYNHHEPVDEEFAGSGSVGG